MIEGAKVVGGASPNSLAVGSKYAYVTNATNDNISIIDYSNHKLVGNIQIKLARLLINIVAFLPFGITISSDEKTLYVALLGLMLLPLLMLKAGQTKGLIPTGWGPTRLRLSPDGNYFVCGIVQRLWSGPKRRKRLCSTCSGNLYRRCTIRYVSKNSAA
jgi:DNA-binding beta-propeller fold protein YncE